MTLVRRLISLIGGAQAEPFKADGEASCGDRTDRLRSVLSGVSAEHGGCEDPGRGNGGIKRNTGHCPDDVTADPGFDQSLKKQENCWRRWGSKRMAIPKKGKHLHPNSKEGAVHDVSRCREFRSADQVYDPPDQGCRAKSLVDSGPGIDGPQSVNIERTPPLTFDVIPCGSAHKILCRMLYAVTRICEKNPVSA
jgi:hypothetical protein